MSVKWGHITDQHFNDVTPAVNSAFFTPGDSHWRQFDTASDIYDAFLAQCVTDSVDFVGQTGDDLDELNSPNGHATAHAALLARRAESGPDGLLYYECIGNHMDELDENGDYSYAAYWSAVDAIGTSGTRNNVFTTNTDEMAYTFDSNGVRFIVVRATFQSPNGTYPTLGDDLTGGGSQGEWLLARLNETSLPVVIFSHTNLIPNIQYGYGYETGLQGTPKDGDIRTILETNANQVQAVFSGHFHRNSIDTWGSDLFTTVNGIHYVQLRGSVLGADDGSRDNATSADGAYYIIELIPHAVNGMAQIEITGYLKGLSKPFKKYLALGA